MAPLEEFLEAEGVAAPLPLSPAGGDEAGGRGEACAAAPAAGSTGVSSPAASQAAPSLRMLRETDFINAREQVRPTRGRFAAVNHGVGGDMPTPLGDFDASLYD